MAVIVALESLDERCDVKLHSDSQYVVHSITNGSVFRWRDNGWGLNASRTKLAKNADLWERLLQAYERHHVELFWVKGHSGIEDNERCDRLAAAAMRRGKLSVDEGYQEAQPPDSTRHVPHPPHPPCVDKQAASKRSARQKTKKSRPAKKTSVRRKFAPPTSTVMITDEGEPCRKCHTPVIKRTSKRTTLKPNQAPYYAWLLYCPNCHAHYIVESARREVARDTCHR